MDRLDELAIFVAIVDEGSLAAASRKLRRSPPAVTRALATLEERVATRLVERTTRRCRPTEAGRRLAEHARQLLAGYGDAVGEVAAGSVRGVLRVTAPLVFGRRHVTPIVASFLDAYPGVRVELVLSDRNLDLIADELDVALRIGALADSSLVARKLGSTTWFLVATPAYLRKRGRPRTPEDLNQHDCLLFGAGSTSVSVRLDSGDQSAQVAIAARLLVSDFEILGAAALAGLGIVLLPAFQCIDGLRARRLERVLHDWAPPSTPIHIVANWPNARRGSCGTSGVWSASGRRSSPAAARATVG